MVDAPWIVSAIGRAIPAGGLSVSSFSGSSLVRPPDHEGLSLVFYTLFQMAVSSHAVRLHLASRLYRLGDLSGGAADGFNAPGQLDCVTGLFQFLCIVPFLFLAIGGPTFVRRSHHVGDLVRLFTH